MKKVLFITQSTIGGTLEYFKLIIPRISKNYFKIEVVCPFYGPMTKELKAMGVKVYNIDMSREISLKKDFISIINLIFFLKRNNYDIIHLHSTKAGALGRIANIFFNIPCVYTPHGWAFSMNVSNSKKCMYILIEKLLSYFSNKVVAISKYEKELGQKYKIREIVPIYNGINVNKYLTNYEAFKQKFYRDNKIKRSTKIIGMVGRLTEQKNPIIFIDIAKKLLEIDNNFLFLLVGDGELRQELERKISSYCIENHFIITGWVNNVEDYISLFNIGVLTSQWEGFGLVLVEYMAAKVPIVASNVGGIGNVVINNKCGTLVNKYDINGFVKGILDLVNNNSLRERYIKNGYKRVHSRFNIDRVVKQHIKLYSNLIKGIYLSEKT